MAEKPIEQHTIEESVTYLKNAFDQHCVYETSRYYKEVLDHIVNQLRESGS